MRAPNESRRTTVSVRSVGLRTETGLRRVYPTLSPAPWASWRRFSSRISLHRIWRRRASSAPERPIYRAPYMVHDAVEHFCRLPPVGLVAVFRVLPLPNVRDHAHPERLLAVAVRVVSHVGVEEDPGQVESVPPDFTQHGRKLDRVVDAARRADGGQYGV